MTHWVKLQRYSDWGVEYLAYPEEGLKQDAAKWSLGLDFSKTPTLRVRWPNGDITQSRIVEKTKKTDVCDMGHVYETSTATVYVEEDLRGTIIRIPLHTLEVEYGSIPYRDGRTPKAPPPREWMTYEEAEAKGIIRVGCGISHGGEWDVEVDFKNRRVGVRRWS